MPVTDESKMPYGIHKGKRMIDVPAHYLIWLYENGKCSGLIAEYIRENLEALQKEISDKIIRKEYNL